MSTTKHTAGPWSVAYETDITGIENDPENGCSGPDSLTFNPAYAGIGKRFAELHAEEAKPAPEPFAFVHKRGTDDEEFIHAEAVNAHCPDCEPMYLGAAPAAPAHVPLTWEQFVAACEAEYGGDFAPEQFAQVSEEEQGAFMRVARMIERAHGIAAHKENKHGN